MEQLKKSQISETPLTWLSFRGQVFQQVHQLYLSLNTEGRSKQGMKR